MLAISNLSAFYRNPSISNLFIVPKNPRLLRPVPSMASSKVVAEYAKSGRSSCKKCSKAIAAKALRLGLVSRDARGFDMTKWHHFNCFPLDSKDSVASPDEIKGFSSLTSSDQETLKKLIEESACPTEKVADGAEDEGSETKIARSSRVRKTDKGGNDDLEDRNSKKIKLSVNSEGAKLGISFSLSDAKDKYKDATLLPKWKAFQTVIFLEQDEGLHDSGKIAAFDFDGCLVNTSMKRVGADAWSLMYSSIPDKLQRLYSEGYKLVIFTNESNIDRWKNKRQVAVDSKIGRLSNFIKLVKVPIQEKYWEEHPGQAVPLMKPKFYPGPWKVFIACGIGKSDSKTDDPFCKPMPGMWHLMEQHFNSGISVDMDQSFYVGDASGRPNDRSDADIKFAQAIGLKFFVPEEYFST